MATQSLGTAVMTVIANMAGFNANVQGSTNTVIRFQTSLTNINTALTRAGIILGVFSAGLTAALKSVVTAGKEFEQAIQVVRAVTNASAKDFELLRDRALELGSTTKFTSKEVAEGMLLLAMSGFKTEEILQTIAPTLDLAVIGMMELSDAADVAANVLLGFRLQAFQLSRVVDVLAAVETNTNSTVRGTAEAFKMVAPAAANAGQSIESVAVAIGLLANAGLKGTIAGTGLARIFEGLVKDIPKLEAALAKYGATFDDVNPAANDFLDIIRQFKIIGITATDVTQLFGERAGRTLLALKNVSFAALDAIELKIKENSLGVAIEQAAIRMETLEGRLTLLKSKFDILRISLFEPFREGLKSLVLQFNGLLEKITAFASENANAVKSIGIFLVALAGLSAATASVLGLVVLFNSLYSVLVPTAAAASTLSPLVAEAAAAVAAAASASVSWTTALVGAVKWAGAFLVRASGIGAIILALVQNFDALKNVVSLIWTVAIKPFIDGFSQGVSTMSQIFYDLIYGPLSEIFAFMVEQISAVLGHSVTLKSVFSVLGNLVGIVLVTAFQAVTLAITKVVAAVTVGTAAFAGLLNVGVAIADWFGMKDALGLEYTEEAVARLAEEARQATIAMKQFLASAEFANMNKLLKETQELSEYLALLSNPDQLKPLQWERLAELEQKFGKVAGAVAIFTNNLQKSLSFLEEQQGRVDEGSEAYAKFGIMIAEVKRQMEVLSAGNKAWMDGMVEGNELIIERTRLTATQMYAMSEEIKAREKLMQAVSEFDENEAEMLAEHEKLLDKMRVSRLNGIEKTIDAIEREKEAVRQSAVNLLAGTENRLAAAKAQVALEEQNLNAAQNELSDAEAEGNADEIKQKEETIERISRALEENQRKVQDYRATIQRLTADAVQHEKQSNEALVKSTEEAVEKQKDILLDDQIERAKRAKDEVQVRELEAQKFVQSREEMKKKNFEFHEKMSEDDKRAMTLRIKQFDEETAAQAAAIRKGEEKKPKKDELSIEEKITEEFGKRVVNLGQIFMIQTALFRLRQKEEEWVVKGAIRALRMQNFATMSKAQGVSPQKQGERDLRARLANLIAQKRANSAGIDLQGLGTATFTQGITDAQAGLQVLAERLERVLNLLKQFMGGMGQAGGLLGSIGAGLSGMPNASISPNLPATLPATGGARSGTEMVANMAKGKSVIQAQFTVIAHPDSKKVAVDVARYLQEAIS